MKACSFCGKDPEVIQIGKRKFLALCDCGAFAAYETPTGIHPAIMKTRGVAARQWDGLIHKLKQ